MFTQIDAPELRELQQRVSDLDAERNAQEARVVQLRRAAAEAMEEDITAEALALNEGKKPPPRREPELRAEADGAARRLQVLIKRHALAVADVNKYISSHHEELGELITGAEKEQAKLVAEGARRVLAELGKLYGLAEDRKLMKPMQPPPPETGPPGSAKAQPFTVGYIGLQGVRVEEGPGRGEIEQVLSYLTSLASKAPKRASSGVA